MTEQTRHILRVIFLTALLAFTAFMTAFFAAQRRDSVTALSEPLIVEPLGFSIRMPKKWQQETMGLPGLRYAQPEKKKAHPDSLDNGRNIFLIALPPKASDTQVLASLFRVVSFWDSRHNNFDGPIVSKPSPPKIDKYEHKQGTVAFGYYDRKRLNRPVELIYYQYIIAADQVFLCVLASDNRLTVADHILLDAVIASFHLIGDQV